MGRMCSVVKLLPTLLVLDIPNHSNTPNVSQPTYYESWKEEQKANQSIERFFPPQLGQKRRRCPNSRAVAARIANNLKATASLAPIRLFP